MTSSGDTHYSVPIDAESRGKARELLRRIYAENAPAFVRVTELLKPLKDRSRRLPGRRPRPEQLADLVRDWQQIPHQTYRLAFNYKLLGRGLGTVSETRLSTGHNQDVRWEDQGSERAIYALTITVLVDKHGIDVSVHPIYSISEHALARRFQRGNKRGYANVLADLLPIVPPIDPVSGAEWTLRVADGGVWRGQIVTNSYGNHNGSVLSVRTYWSE
jgi:hypothetical protein